MYGLMHRRDIRVKIHIVQKGDTLWKIAKKYGVNFEELKMMNSQLSNPDMIMPGMKIKVPTAGGSIKKEAPMGMSPEAKINMGAKKEMPKTEHPFAKEKPMQAVEAPQPKKEAPKPQVTAPKMEQPKAPFVPKMPQPIIPDIDINNYYMMNMPAPKPQPKPQPKPKAMPKQEYKPKQLEEPAAQMPITMPKQQPQLPPKPMNILPGIKPAGEESPEMESPETAQLPLQGGYKQPMYPYQPNYYQGSPVNPGHGYQQPGHYPQVQGASMPYQQQMPYGMMPGMEGAGQMQHHYEESSSFMPMANTNPMYAQPSGVMGMSDHQQQLPLSPMSQQQLPLQPTQTMPAMQQQYPFPPYPACLHPVSPVMPGPGYGACEPGMPYGYPQQPMVQGAMEGYESPSMAQMPLMPSQSQMPLMPSEAQMPLMPQQGVQGMSDDCGCGSGQPQMMPGMHHGMQPGMHHMGMGMPQMGYGAPYQPQYGQQMGFGQSPYMGQPQGYGPMGGQAFGMPRFDDESYEFNG